MVLYKPPIICVPNVAASVTGLAATFSNFNQIAVYPHQHNLDKVRDLKCDPLIKSRLFHLKSESLIFDSLLRKLINESCGIFISACTVQKNDAPDILRTPQLLKVSRKYRSVLRESIENIQEENLRLTANETDQRYENCISLLYNIEFIWHLTEVLYINSIGDDIALPYVTQWIKFHFPEHERYARKILQTIKDCGLGVAHKIDYLNEGVEHSFEEYWDTIIGLILQGNIEVARILLQLHSQSDTDAFNEVDKILRTMPVYDNRSQISLSEFNMQWKLWQTNVVKVLGNTMFESWPQLKFIIQIMSGDVSSCIDQLKTKLSCWYRTMVAILLYTEPAIKFYELGYQAHKYVQYHGGTASLNYCDATILALFESDLKSAVRKFQLTSDGGWMATHLSHLLTLCGKLDNINIENSSTEESSEQNIPFDQKLILEYGTLLMYHHSLWQVGLCYLDQCLTYGATRQQIILSRIVPSSDMKTMKLLQAALSRGFVDVAASICKVQGVKCLRRKQLGKALEWAFRSQDQAFASHLADQFLKHYVNKGVFESSDLLDNLGSYMLICDRLTFLGKYCEFRKLYSVNKLKDAATCLSDLISSRIAPKYFWLTLLNDALPLLENEQEESLFDTQQTSNLMYCLNELSSFSEGNLSKLLLPAQTSSFDKTIGVVRLAVCKNMAKAICSQTFVNSANNKS